MPLELSKINPVGSINPSTVNLPVIFKFVTSAFWGFSEISNVAPLPPLLTPPPYPPFISIIVWTSVELLIEAPEFTCKAPFPFGAIVIFPLLPLPIEKTLELFPPFTCKFPLISTLPLISTSPLEA